MSHKLFVYLAIFLIFTSCSSTQRAYYKTIKTLNTDRPDSAYSLSEIKRSPADLLYIRVGENLRAVMALAFIEKGQYKWVSADGAMLIEASGRVIKTVGMRDKLHYVSSLDDDPLAEASAIGFMRSWSRSIDYAEAQYETNLHSKFEVVKSSVLSMGRNSIDASLVLEHVFFNPPNKASAQWTNKYWYDKKSGRLLKAIQKITPESEIYSLTYVSRIARLPYASSLLGGE